MTTACMILSGTFSCLGQMNGGMTLIGTDIVSGICFHTLRVGVAHGFRDNWSAGGELGLDLDVICRSADETEQSHRELTSDQSSGQAVPFRQTFLDTYLHIDYWPQKVFRGPHLSFGGRLRDRSSPDITVGAGYCIRIWKGLGADISYTIGILETYKNKTLSYNNIKAGIHYVF